jgi:hypothetical protein
MGGFCKERILRNVQSNTPISKIGRNFPVLPMRIYRNFLLSVPLSRIYEKFLTTNSWADCTVIIDTTRMIHA